MNIKELLSDLEKYHIYNSVAINKDIDRVLDDYFNDNAPFEKEK